MVIHYDMIMKHPQICQIEYTDISKVKQQYIAKISPVFGNKSIDNTKDLLSYIYTWRKSIPEYTRSVCQDDPLTSKLLVYIDSINKPDYLIFNRIAEVFGLEEINDNYSIDNIKIIAKKLSGLTKKIQNIYPNLIKKINLKLVNALRVLQKKCLGEVPFNYAKRVNLARVFQQTLQRFKDDIDKLPIFKKNFSVSWKNKNI